MNERKSSQPADRSRGEPVRQRVLNAAEHLLSQGNADFSMRDLADEARVSFATPFNRFGSKAAIMFALSSRRIDAMEARYGALALRGDSIKRVKRAVQIGSAVMLEQSAVNRVVMGWLGSSNPEPGQAFHRSQALWSLALGKADGLRVDLRNQALEVLPVQLAFGFRGVLSFWTSGEIADRDLAGNAIDIAEGLMTRYKE